MFNALLTFSSAVLASKTSGIRRNLPVIVEVWRRISAEKCTNNSAINQVYHNCEGEKEEFASESKSKRAFCQTPNIMDAPIKSQHDKREYRCIKLANGLTALLISDLAKVGTETEVEEDEDDKSNDGSGSSSEDSGEGLDEDSAEEDGSEVDGSEEEDDEDDDQEGHNLDAHSVKDEKMAAAGLCVGVGSFSDPDDLPGLAHLLEHVVFMGSEKYPTENSFDSFIKRHGGSDNASTDCERTIFEFEIHKKHFYEALNRFAQFFIAPLLRKDSLDREIESVDSEFQMSLPSDNHRKQQIFGCLAVEGHPMRKFMMGNVATLKYRPTEQRIDVRQRLVEFWKRYYSAQYMTLAVQSRETLDTLEKWVTEIFSAIPNNGLPPPNFSDLTDPFDTPRFRKLYQVLPVKNSHQLEINWALPSQLEFYRVKPLQYLSFLIGHEGKGSIMSYLKRKVWALNLWSGNCEQGFEHNTCYSAFTVSVELTDDGLDHLFEVITAVFTYVEMLRRVGPQERVYKEIQTVDEMDFRWHEESSPVVYVEELCDNMQLYPPCDYITGNKLMFQYDEEVIKACADALVPERANIAVLSKRFEKADQENFAYEHWYQIPFQELEIDEGWLKAWKTLEPRADFYIPEVNKFIATDFEIKEPDRPSTELPIKILDNSQSRLWYKKDNRFNIPKAHINFHLISPIASSSPQSAVLLDLFVHVLEQNIQEGVYAAGVAQLSYSIRDDETGLIISLHGFNHKLPALFETILDHIANFDVTEELFKAIKIYQSKVYYNSFIKPSKLCKDVRISILQQVRWTPVDKRAVIGGITKDMLLAFAKEFKGHLFVEGLVQGNITAQDALDLDVMVKTKLNTCEVPWNMLPEVRVMQLPKGEHYCRVASFNKDDCNSVVTNYYQSGCANIHEACLMELLLNFMEEPCFDILRTREQLGYYVNCMCRVTFGVLGFSVTVHTQADKFSCSQVDEKIEEFLIKFNDKLSKISEKEFQTQVTSLIKLKRCVDLHLKEEVDRNWGEILSSNYLFDRLDREINCLEKITLEELKSWYGQHLRDGYNFRKLGVQVVGTGRMQDGLVRASRKRRSSSRSCSHNPEKSTKPSKADEKVSHAKPKKAEDIAARVLATKESEKNISDAEDVEEETSYALQFVPHPDSEKDELFITDIRGFKQNLMIHRIAKITE